MSTPSRTLRHLIAVSTFALALPMAATAQPNYEGLGPLASDRPVAAADRPAVASDRPAATPDQPGTMPHGRRHGGPSHHAHPHHVQPHHAHPHHGLARQDRGHQGHAHHGHPHRAHPSHFHGAGADTPFARGTGGGAAWLRGLQLDDAQRDRVFEIMHAQAPALRAQAKALRTARSQLHAISLSGNYDEARAQSLAEAAGRAHSEIARLRAGSMQALYQVLTPEQRRQVEQRRMQPGEGHVRGMPR